MQMQENAKLQRQLMELEHDKFVNNQTNQELAAIQELVERKDRDEKTKFKIAWEAQQQMKREQEEVERLF